MDLLDRKQLNDDIRLFGQSQISQWLVLFRENNLPLIERLKSAYQAGEVETIRSVSHQLKSSSGSLSMSTLSHYFGDIEKTYQLDVLKLDALVSDSLYSLGQALNPE